MDPDQWRSFSSVYSTLPRIELPLHPAKQSGLSAGALSSHAHSLTGLNVDHSGLYKSTGLITDPLGPSKPLNTADDKARNWSIPGLTQTSTNYFGELPTDLSPGNQRPPPAHQGSFQNIPGFPLSKSSHSSSTHLFNVQPFERIRHEQSFLVPSNTDRSVSSDYHYSQTVKSESEYNPISSGTSVPQTGHFGSQLSRLQSYRNPENFVYNSENSSQNYGLNQNEPVTSSIYNHSIPYHITPSPAEKPQSVTIQAVADSTTKPRGRGRKKKETTSIVDTKPAGENKLVDSYIQQEQHSRFHRNTYKHMSGSIYGHSFTSPTVSHNSQLTSSFSGEMLDNSYPISPNKNGNFNCVVGGTIMDNIVQTNTNSTIHGDTYSPHGIPTSNNFMLSNSSQGYMASDCNIPLIPEERIMGNHEFPFNAHSSQQSFVEQLNSSSDYDTLNTMDSGLYSGHLFNFNNCGTAVSTSTVDEAALSSLITDNHSLDKQFETYRNENHQNKPFLAEPSHPSTGVEPCQPPMVAEPIQPPVAVINPIDEDDEFLHLKKPPDTEKPQVKVQLSVEKKLNLQPRVMIEALPLEISKSAKSAINKNNAFMDSFLSFIQGKKPETLSSVNTSVVKKPELPKYIPEPKRPPRQTSVEKSSDSAASTPGPESNEDTSSRMTMSTPGPESNDEEPQITCSVKNIESGNDQNPGLKMTIKLQTVSPPKPKKTKSKRLSNKQKRSLDYAESEDEKMKSSGEEYQVESSQEERTPSPVVPVRRLTTRKAKEKVLQKKFRDSDSEADDVGPETYDSDSDPAWTPFAEEKEPGLSDYHGSQRRGRSRVTRGKVKPKQVIKSGKPTPAKTRKVEQAAPTAAHPPVPSPHSSDTEEEKEDSPAFVMGSFVINEKDINNFEGFPIWKIEAGKMMRKYELFIEKGEIYHRSLSTYSSWLPNMEKNYIPVRTRSIPIVRTSVKDSQFVVQVLEEDRPKPKLDLSKETEYEKDPLADMFNVYLQVFLSQAMEPGFLGAIHESGEDFYMKPLNKIDDIISKKLLEISSKVRWKQEFKKAAELRPHIREVERPHLKSLCQATENATQNAVKSVHLFGQPYNKTTLEEIQDSSVIQGSVEFLVGRTASNYIGAFHSLHHFKYNLYKRCLAKVDIVREGNTELDNAEILDKCLNNRTWVLKIFDDLKNMLEKG